MIKGKITIKKNLFDLTEEQKAASISLYGKVLKCLIAPYHTINTIPLEPNDEVFVFPERDLTINQRKELCSVMVSAKRDEICFVTSDLFIINEMISDCCRILTPDGEIEPCRTQTFSANAHDIILKVLKNDKHDARVEMSVKIINDVISAIQEGSMTKAEYKKNKEIIDSIGERLIRMKLQEMLMSVKIK